MRWLRLCFSLAPAFSQDFFYRPITSGSCEDVGCNSMSASECEQAFEHMKATSQTADSPTVRYYLGGTTSIRPVGCLADFNLTTSSLQYNEALTTFSASRVNPVYCICDGEGEYMERDEFDEAVQWCNGWLADVEIDPTRSWVESGSSGTPSIVIRSLGRELDSRTVGLLFQPGAGFAKSSLVSIGIHFAEIPTGVQLSVSLRGCRASTAPKSTPLECDEGTADAVFSDIKLQPGKGDEDVIYFNDLQDTYLDPDWTYFLEYEYPPPLPSRDSGRNDIFWSVRLPIYHPILEIPWDYVFEDTAFFQSVKPYNAELFNGWWNEPITLPRLVFKLCTPSHEVSNGCGSSDFLSLRCNQWLFAVVVVAILIVVLCCVRFCCWLSRKQTGVVCLNFVDYNSGTRWFRREVPASQPIQLLCFDVADMMDLPRKSVSLWLETGQRLRWCYCVGDYRIDAAKDIFVVQRKCNNLCGCCSIEDLFGVCIPPPSFSNVPIEERSRNDQSTRLIR